MAGTDAREDVQLLRRKFLRMAAYVPPAIVGVMIAGQKVAEAGVPIAGTVKPCKGGGVITVSAGGNACCPCVPTDPEYNPNKCELARCKLGNCAACRRAIFKSVQECQKKVAQAGCNCVCQPLPGGLPLPGGKKKKKGGPAVCR